MVEPKIIGPLPEALRERANDVLERLFKLDEVVANARAFRAMLEDLHRRDLTMAVEPHVSAVHMVRASILRAAIGTLMSCLDPADRQRGNRASVGQILDLLDDADLAGAFPENAASADASGRALAQAKALYAEVVQGDAFRRGRALRNDAISHVLVRDEATPTVEYETVYQLQDAVERLVIDLYTACCRGGPNFVGHHARFTELAGTFWDTYFAGMVAPRDR